MADSITAIAKQPAVVASTSDSSSLTLDPDWSYELRHLGEAVGGGDQTDPIYYANDATAVNSYAASVNKGVLQYIANQGGLPVTVGPGVTTLQYISSSNVPTFMVTPIRKWSYRW
ncbi:hypothetical protein LCGC14_2659480 [marine sediment metagenome]|uniref:Uncharacterized protein n=1 Tax=marine sediment metagenome TaxID=412755 RepID=A0A0F9CJ96_9ZZZZ